MEREKEGNSTKEIEITEEMIRAGLVELYAYDPESMDGKDTVKEIIRAALTLRAPQ